MLREIADGIVFAGEHDEVKLIVIDSAAKSLAAASTSASTPRNVSTKCWKLSQAAFAAMLEVSSPFSAS